MRLRHRIVGLVGGRRALRTAAGVRAPRTGSATPRLDAATPVVSGAPAPPVESAGAESAGPNATSASVGPGAAAAASLAADPCAPARAAVEDACSLADRMNALALAALDRLTENRRDYEEHLRRRGAAASAADPIAVRAAKDEAQAAFRSARLAAQERPALEAAAGEWLREIDRINARTREAVRIIAREDAADLELLRAVDRLGVAADGARIAAESAAEACRNARINLANCEEHERVGLDRATAAVLVAALAPASVVARATFAPLAEEGAVAGSSVATAAGADPAAAGSAEGRPAAVQPAILPLLAGDRSVLRRMAADLAGGDQAAQRQWEARLDAFVEAVRARAIDGAALGFPDDNPFWSPYTQVQCREISAALTALGYHFDGLGGFSDGRVPGQRELSLAIGYAGLDPMRVRIWPNEAELPLLYADVHVESGRFLAETAGELTLGEMIDVLGRRAEDLSELWNAWGRVRPLLLEPA